MSNIGLNSLRFRLIVYLGLIILISLGIFHSYNYTNLKNNLEKDLNARADTIVSRLINELQYGLWELDEEIIDKTVLSESKIQEVHAIYVTSESGINVVLDKDHSTVNHDESIIRENEILKDGKVLGKVKLIVSYDLMNKRLSDERNKAIYITIIQIIFMTLFLWYMINKIILYPIDNLIHSTKLIAAGKYSDVEVEYRNDEIGVLSDSIHKMSSKISEREYDIKKSAVELSNVKEQLELAVNGTQDGIWDWNIETNELYFSEPWKRMIGYEDEELTNEFETWESRVHPDDLANAIEAIKVAHSNPGSVYECIFRFKHKDGSWIWILSRGNTIFNKDGKPIRMVGFHTNITKQKELEAEILEQEELLIAQSRNIAMGEMISMIAHQWRQPITVIAMGANNMMVNIELDNINKDEFRVNAENIVKQTTYLSKTIDDFKNFFKPDKDKDIVKVGDLIHEAEELMGKSIINSNIELIVDGKKDITVETYSRELLQVLLNLLKNSKEAIIENRVDNAYIKVIIEDIGKNISIHVCDNGGGIKDSVKSSVFEPYYSTKGPKAGTGLGLYMSKIIVEKHLHGDIKINDIENGTCFTIRVPKMIEGDSK